MTDTLLVRTPAELGDLCFICSCQKYIECYLPSFINAKSMQTILPYNNDARVTVYRGKNAFMRQFDLLDMSAEQDSAGHRKRHYIKTIFIHTKIDGMIRHSHVVTLPAIIPLNYYLYSTGNPDEHRITITFDKCYKKREFEVLDVII